MSWAIWCTKNDYIFEGIQPEQDKVREKFEKELRILTLQVKAKFSATFDLWIQNLL